DSGLPFIEFIRSSSHQKVQERQRRCRITSGNAFEYAREGGGKKMRGFTKFRNDPVIHCLRTTQLVHKSPSPIRQIKGESSQELLIRGVVEPLGDSSKAFHILRQGMGRPEQIVVLGMDSCKQFCIAPTYGQWQPVTKRKPGVMSDNGKPQIGRRQHYQ